MFVIVLYEELYFSFRYNGLFTGWYMAYGEYYPSTVNSINEKQAYKTTNAVKLYTSINRAKKQALKICRQTNYIAQIVSVYDIEIAKKRIPIIKFNELYEDIVLGNIDYNK